MGDPIAIAVVGAGAIGGALAAALGDAGYRVTLCDRILFEVLRRTFKGDTRLYEHPVITSPEGLKPVDWLLLCTKAHQVVGATPWLERLIGPDTYVAVMQNGVDHARRVKSFVDPDRVVPAIMLLPVEVVSPGEIVQRHNGHIQVPDSPAGHYLASLFPPDGAVVFESVSDFVSACWSKLAFNAVGGGIGCLILGPLGAVTESSVRDLATSLFQEVMAVGRAEGAVFPEDFVERTLTQFSSFSEQWESIAVDRREGRQMEWHARNAVVGEIGRKHGIDTPLNDAVTALLALIDARLDGRS